MAGASDIHLMEQICTRQVIVVETNYQENLNLKVDEKETDWKVLKKITNVQELLYNKFSILLA